MTSLTACDRTHCALVGLGRSSVSHAEITAEMGIGGRRHSGRGIASKSLFLLVVPFTAGAIVVRFIPSRQPIGAFMRGVARTDVHSGDRPTIAPAAFGRRSRVPERQGNPATTWPVPASPASGSVSTTAASTTRASSTAVPTAKVPIITVPSPRCRPESLSRRRCALVNTIFTVPGSPRSFS